MKYKSEIFVNNIKYLAEKKDKKIGEIEKAAGVTAGYLSRLDKGWTNLDAIAKGADTKGATPKINFVMSIAEQLEVSIDLLLTVDLTKPNPRENKIAMFLEKLYQDTVECKQNWQKECYEKFKDRIDEFYHPLMKEKINRQSDIETEYYFSFESDFSTERTINGDVFHAVAKDINGERDLYLVRVDDPEYPFLLCYELYLVDEKSKKHAICSGNEGDNLFYKYLNDLYVIAYESCQHLNVDDTVDSFIDNYLKGEDDLPF